MDTNLIAPHAAPAAATSHLPPDTCQPLDSSYSIHTFPSESLAVDWLARHPLAHVIGRLSVPSAAVGSRTYLIRQCASESERLAAEEAQRVHGRQALLSYRRHATARWLEKVGPVRRRGPYGGGNPEAFKSAMRDRVEACNRGEPPAQLGEDVL